ncbi:MAG: cation-transporting P-type ATPase [Ruminococcaceae bacterium]|nr:cation-transporting P-type ATPase [Oscillospiraceae bacterium]
MKNRWYDCSVEEIVEKLNSNEQSGLTQKQALTRLRATGKNIIYPISKASFKSYLKQVVTDLTAILLILAAAAAALFEKNACAVAILAILAVNYTVSIVSFIRSQRILEDAAGQSLPSAKVIRDGKLFLVRQEELVRGDIILVCAGDIVPCDARLIECEGLSLLESNLYDVKGVVNKRADFVDARNLPMRERVNMLYASTIVTSGRGKAIVCETGASTLVCSLKKNPSIANHDKLSIIARLQRYSTVASLLSIGLVFLLTLLNFYFSSGRSIFDVFLITLSHAVSSMSELYTAFAYIIISLGIFGAVRQFNKVNTGAVIKNASGIEKMKSINCLLIPKESLFLEKEMKLNCVYTQGMLYSVFDPRPGQAMCETLRYAVISSGLYGAGKLVNNNIRSNHIYSAEEEAIIRAARQCALYDKSLDAEYPMIEHVGYGRESRFDTTLFRQGSQFRIALRGDVRHVIANCTSYRKDTESEPLNAKKRSELLYEADRLMREHYKVVAVATKNSVYNNLRRLPACQNDLTFEGFICIQEPILPDAAMNIARCRNAGIRVIMFSSDISEGNRSLASSLGIIQHEDEAVSIAQLSQMRDDLIRTNLSAYNLYEGLNNAQLRHIMRWLKEDLEYEIGVLGRTLDDVGLIRDADVGFAEVLTLSESASKGGVECTPDNMPALSKNARDSGKNGCEALKFISDVAVSKPDRHGNGGFNAVVAAIASSKAIYLNIFQTVCYLLLTHSTRLFIVLFATFTDLLLLQPHQMLFTGLIVDLLAVFVIAFTRADPRSLQDNNDYEKKLTLLPLRQFPIVLLGLGWGSLSYFSAWVMLWLHPDSTADQISSLIFVSFIICQLLILLSISNPSVFSGQGIRVNAIYLIAVLLCVGFILLSFFNGAVQGFFTMVPIEKDGIWIIFIPALGTLILTELYKLYRDRGQSKRSNLPKKKKTLT